MSIRVTRAQPIAKDLLVAHERVLSAGLLMVVRFPLPLASSNLVDASDDTISRSASTTARLRSLDRRHNDLRASASCSVVQRAIVVGTVSGYPPDLTRHAIEKTHANVAVIGARSRQLLANDHAIC